MRHLIPYGRLGPATMLPLLLPAFRLPGTAPWFYSARSSNRPPLGPGLVALSSGR